MPATIFLTVSLALAVGLLILNTIEVGRNDAANLVNAVFGARILDRKLAVRVAGIGVVLGAVASGGVIETVRREIFVPQQLPSLHAAVAVYLSVYIVNTVLLNAYSAYGMPVSTTASLVFALLGASSVAGGLGVVNWAIAGKVVTGIVCSILLSGIAAFLVQRAVRGAIRGRPQQLGALLLHGGWVGGGMTAGLCYFLLAKGMKHVGFIKYLNEHVVSRYGDAVVVLFLWGVFTIAIHALLVVYRKRAARVLFPALAVVAMIAMAFAFGQNDLANCASPGLSTLALIDRGDVNIGTQADIPLWALFACGLLLVLGMGTKNAERVTRAEVATGSMSDHVGLWAPQWCVGLATHILRLRGRAPTLAPMVTVTETGKTMHYDSLRACVILSVSACVIATASGLKLPVSTTYVDFAAVVATGMADRILQRGDAALKLARSIWVVFSWFASAAIASTASAVLCLALVHLGTPGIAGGLVASVAIWVHIKRRADVQAKRVQEEAYERAHPEEFAPEDES